MQVLCFLFDPNIGGPTKRAAMVSTVLRTQGITVSFALPATRGTAAGFLEDAGFTVTDIGIAKPVTPQKVVLFLRFLARAPYDLLKLIRLIRRKAPDVIHVNGAFDILPAFAGRCCNTRIVWHLNDMVFGPKLSRFLGWIVDRVADVIVVSSPRVADHYGVVQSNPSVLPVPVDVGRFEPCRGQRRSPARITLIGNWNPLKQQQDFIAALEQLAISGCAIEGRIVGKLLDSQADYWQPLLNRINASDCPAKITAPGFCDNIPAVLSEADIVVVTSISESGPMCCVEAMAAGVPVVSYDVGDVRSMLAPDTAQACGIVTTVNDVYHLVAGLHTLLGDDTLYERFSAQGPKRATELYAVESVAEKTRMVYARAME